MKPIDVTDDSFAEYDEESNKKDPKFKIGNHVRISKYKNIFAEGYAPNWSEEVFIVSKIRNTVEAFMRKNYRVLINKYSFNSWINKKDIL